MFFGYSVRSPHRTAKPSRGCLRVVGLKPHADFPPCKRRGTKVINKKTKRGRGCPFAECERQGRKFAWRRAIRIVLVPVILPWCVFVHSHFKKEEEERRRIPFLVLRWYISVYGKFHAQVCFIIITALSFLLHSRRLGGGRNRRISILNLPLPAPGSRTVAYVARAAATTNRRTNAR